MIEIQIINILSLLWKHNTFLAVYCTLVTDLKTKKRAKQISKKDKTKTKKNRKKGKRKYLADFENGTFRLTWPHIATTPLRMVTWFDENFNAFYIKLPPANDRGKRSSHTIIDWKNDSQQSDEIKANWNQATDTKKQCKRISWQWRTCDTNPTQLLRRSRTQNISLLFSYLDFRCYVKGNAQTRSNSLPFPPVILGSP